MLIAPPSWSADGDGYLYLNKKLKDGNRLNLSSVPPSKTIHNNQFLIFPIKKVNRRTPSAPDNKYYYVVQTGGRIFTILRNVGLVSSELNRESIDDNTSLRSKISALSKTNTGGGIYNKNM